MVDRWEELAHIQVHHILVSSEIKSTTVEGDVRAFAFTVGVTIENELPFEQWLDHIHQCMMNDTVSKGSGADQPSFWFLDFKTMITARLVTLVS